MAADAPSPVRVERLEGGALWRVTLSAPKANVLDAAMVDALAATVARTRAEPGTKAVVVEGEGAHFSFGASVQEHLPGRAEGMLRRFHALFFDLLEAGVPWLAAVRGRCLGGGLELASFCQRVFAAPDAILGQPEIVLGVFAPMASAFLAERVGRPAAEDLLLSGRSVGADEALRMRLVDEVAADPAEAALAWARTHLLGKSASSLRFAARAARLALASRWKAEIAALERLYLLDLMATADAKEGLAAFLEKRPARWSDR